MIWLVIYAVVVLALFVAGGIDDTRAEREQNAKYRKGTAFMTPVCPGCGRVYPCICPGGGR